jgi:multidrug efflux pump
MSLSTPFIRRPVGTTLLTLAISLAGVMSYGLLPVSPLPQVDFPTIQVSASLPGAGPETMAATVATPLERQLTRIAGISEMSSQSTMGSCFITLQFDLERNVDAAGRDVQAAINAARGQLPPNLPFNPSYRKYNPSDSPVIMLALTSRTHTKSRMYDVASNILQQRLSQVPGVGQVTVSGGSPPAIRASVDPTALHNLGLSLADVRTAITAANANRPKGILSDKERYWTISATDQLLHAEDYGALVIAFRNDAPIRLRDIAKVEDSVDNVRNMGVLNDKPAISVEVFRQPNANIVQVADSVRALLPHLEAQIPADMDLTMAVDRTNTIRASIHDVNQTLLLSVMLVVAVVYVFLGEWRSTLIPTVAVPVSLLGTFGAMYLVGYSVDNLSMMALTVATGFVVDDAIVVMENIARHRERGASPLQAALVGAREIGFTVLAISVSLMAVFIPVLLMRGLVGRLFHQFAVTLSIAIAVSLVVSLTTTPMMCAVLLKTESGGHPRQTWSRWLFERLTWLYGVTLTAVLRHQTATLALMVAMSGATLWLYMIVPKGLFPRQDNGRLIGSLQADQNISFQAMSRLIEQSVALIREDPAVHIASCGVGSSGGGGVSSARMYVLLKPRDQRDATADEVIARIRKNGAKLAGANIALQAAQDLRVGGRFSSAAYQFTLTGETLRDLEEWAPRLTESLRKLPGLADVNIDQQSRGLQTRLNIDRDTATRLGVEIAEIDDALYDAFGQRQVSKMYLDRNQYNVVLDVPSDFSQSPDALRHVYVRSRGGDLVPLDALHTRRTENIPLSVNHTGLFPSVTISFNLAPGTTLGDVVDPIQETARSLGLPESIRGQFQGTAQVFQDSLKNQPILILAAIVSVYIVLGMLYESYLHPLTILSTLPSAGAGALVALLVCQAPLDVVALIGILLLIGVVMKNAIMMIDLALETERSRGLSPRDAIHEACLARFRPILMTTLAALFGGLPLALGTGVGSELRRPLGIAIVGGLILSQLLTLYTTPVVYLFLGRLAERVRLWRKPVAGGAA